MGQVVVNVPSREEQIERLQCQLRDIREDMQNVRNTRSLQVLKEVEASTHHHIVSLHSNPYKHGGKVRHIETGRCGEAIQSLTTTDEYGNAEFVVAVKWDGGLSIEAVPGDDLHIDV